MYVRLYGVLHFGNSREHPPFFVYFWRLRRFTLWQFSVLRAFSGLLVFYASGGFVLFFTLGGDEVDELSATLPPPPDSNCLRSRNRAAASRMRENSMQNACTSMNSSWNEIKIEIQFFLFVKYQENSIKNI